MGRRHLAALTGAAVLAACGGCGDEVEGSFKPLGAAVREAARTGQPIRLASVTDFDWDRVHALYAYSSDEEIEDELGFGLGGADDTMSSVQDGYSLLVFVKDGELARAFDHEPGDGYLVCIGPQVVRGGLTPAEAVLSVAPSDRGNPPVVSLAHPRDARQARLTKRCLRTYS
jgi:hypothetical protein